MSQTARYVDITFNIIITFPGDTFTHIRLLRELCAEVLILTAVIIHIISNNKVNYCGFPSEYSLYDTNTNILKFIYQYYISICSYIAMWIAIGGRGMHVSSWSVVAIATYVTTILHMTVHPYMYFSASVYH